MLNIALIGCGRIAGHHCRAIRATGGLALAALCDLERDKAAQWNEENDTPVFADYREMLNQHPEIDVVAVITPSGMHFEHAAEVLDNWNKHLILEKPAVMRLQDLDRLVNAAGDHGKRIFPVFQNRYNKAIARVRDALKSDELGALRLACVRVRWCRPQRYYNLAPWRGTFAMDGGALTNQGIHHVDLLRHLGGEVATVKASMRTLGADIEVEDTVVATVEFKSGALGTVEVTTAARPNDYEASLSLVTENGLAQVGGIAVNELQVFTPDPDECAAHSEDFSDCIYGYGHYQMYEDLRDDLDGSRAYPVTLDDCRQTLELLHAFYVSDERGQAVSPGAESTRLGRADEALAALYRTPRKQN